MSLLYLTFLFPLIGFLLLASLRDRLPENAAAAIGVGSMGLSALTALYVGLDFLAQTPSVDGAYPAYQQILWTWLKIGEFAPAFGQHLDGLALTMMGVNTKKEYWPRLLSQSLKWLSKLLSFCRKVG